MDKYRYIYSDDDDDDNEQVYCSCRSSDTSRFMIACDNCEEWFHGDCESVEEAFSKKIDTYYCIECRRKNSSLRIVLKNRFQKPLPLPPTKSTKSPSPPPSPPRPQKPPTKVKPRIPDDVLSGSDFEDELKLQDEEEAREIVKKMKKEKTPQKRKYQRKPPKPKAPKPKKEPKAPKAKKTKASTKGKTSAEKKTSSRRSRKSILSDDEGEDIEMGHSKHVNNNPRQCFGPGCTKVARKTSKFCSDECGISLATKRIRTFVPTRLAEWGSAPCAADEYSKRELETIRKERTHALDILSDINKKQDELESIVVRGRNASPYSEEECCEIIDNDAEGDVAVSCPTCSQEIMLKVALKHMEKCFNKVESRTSFCSAVKPKDNQNVFCDYLNSVNGTYCKRLRLLCPEHSKESRTAASDEVCGCPLRNGDDPFRDGYTYCRMLKKKCNTHYGWEKFRQASLDAQKIQQWLKLDELYEREQKIISSLNGRHGLVQLLLHRTILHPV